MTEIFVQKKPEDREIALVEDGKLIEYYEENIEIMKQKIEELKSNKDFSYNMGSNSGSKSRLQKKVNIALKVFEPKEE